MVNHDELDDILAAEDRKIGTVVKELGWEENSEAASEFSEKLRREASAKLQHEISEKGGIVTREMAEWTAKAVREKLQLQIDDAHRDIENVDLARRKDHEDIAQKLMIFLGAIVVFIGVLLSCTGMYKGFHEVMFGIYGAAGAVVLFILLRALLNSSAIYAVRSGNKPYEVAVNGQTVLTYEKEKVLYESQILRIGKLMSEADKYVRRAEKIDGLPLADYERLQMLQFAQRHEVLAGYTKQFTFWEYIRGWFKST